MSAFKEIVGISCPYLTNLAKYLLLLPSLMSSSNAPTEKIICKALEYAISDKSNDSHANASYFPRSSRIIYFSSFNEQVNN